MWRLLLVVLSVVAGTASGAAATAPSEPARLAIEATTGSVTSVLVPSEATLECDGDAHGTGYLRRVASPACALVRSGALTKVAKQHDVARLCTEDYGGPQRARIRGTIGSRRVNVAITRSDGCGIAEWNQLAALLGVPERTGAIPRRNPSAAAATTTTAPATTYRVQRGDTLTEIAKQFHTSVAAIVSANQLADADSVADGQDLVMPPPSTARIEAKLVDGRTDAGVDLILVGAAPSEPVIFEITLPDGSTYTGSPHVASGYGVVATTYVADIGSGTYTFTATGDHGTSAETSLHVVPPD